jgi:hypothetical protein
MDVDNVSIHIVLTLLKDLKGRQGFDNQWEATEVDVRQEIVDEWTEIVKRFIKEFS